MGNAVSEANACVLGPLENQRRNRRRLLGDQRRRQHGALPDQRNIAEISMQEIEELRPIKLAHMERIGRGAGRAVDVPVGRADDETPVGPQHPAHLGDKIFLTIEMLDGLE